MAVMATVDSGAGAGALPRVSVVIPTFRRPALLLGCLGGLLQQTLSAASFEIIVVDDGHDAATQQACERFAAEHRGFTLRYLRPADGRGPAVARNAGWRAARASLVAFTDDDTVPQPGWLMEGLHAMADARFVAMAGRVVVPRAAGRPTDHALMTQGLESARFVTANAFVRRRALQAIGGFDEAFKRAWREDSDLEFRLLQSGRQARIGKAAEAVVLHPVRPERWGVSLRQQKNVFYDALLFRKHPQLYRRHIHRRPPWDYFVIVAAALAAPLLALAGAPLAAAALLALALLLVAAFAWRRLRATALTPAHVAEMALTSAAIPFLSVYWRLRGAWHFRVPFL